LFGGHKIEASEDDDFTPGRLFDALEAGDRATALRLLNDILDPADEREGSAQTQPLP